jgi:hypothetical protein
MIDEQEKNQILTRQSETIPSFYPPSEAAETPAEIAETENTLTTNSEAAETPAEIAETENTLTTNSEIAETPAEIAETENTLTTNSEIAETPTELAETENTLTTNLETAETPTELAGTENTLTTNLETETPTEIVATENTLTTNPEAAVTPTETLAPEDILTRIHLPETVPIVADITPETIDEANYPTQLNQTANPDPKKTRIWQLLAVFLSGMLVGSVLSLGTLLAWRMYQERVNLQIKLPADVPLPESPSPIATTPANRQPTIPPAPGSAQLPVSNTPPPNPTQVPSLSGISQLPSPSPSVSPSPSPSVSPTLETAVTERVSFAAGATGTTVSNSLPENKSKRYLLECNSGQNMTVSVQDGQVSAAIIAPNGEKVGTANSTTPWQGQLPSSGDYTIEISGDNKANYGVKIEVK